MIAYILEGVSPSFASGDKRMQRLANVGPWQYQLHESGTFATWRGAGPVPITNFADPRPTRDGMLYMGPKVLPQVGELLRPSMMQRPDLADVVISEEEGVSIKILPAYLSPRKIMDDNTTGDFTTLYGRAIRAVVARANENPTARLRDFYDEVAECARLAIMYTHRMTRELIEDMCILNEESIFAIWEASIHVPKSVPAEEGGRSA